MTKEDAPRGRAAKAGTDFSRIRPSPTVDSRPTIDEVQPDQEGKRALFSSSAPQTPQDSPASFGAVIVSCGRCEARTVLTPAQALHYVVPSFHLPFIKPKHGSWMRCPSCDHRTWVSVEIQL
ncbi:MAG TPA: hypothetical protein VMT88_13090 [Actinomycetes bacterium]|nr:hypothetical protein [Actinomycetes bacterium]